MRKLIFWGMLWGFISFGIGAWVENYRWEHYFSNYQLPCFKAVYSYDVGNGD